MSNTKLKMCPEPNKPEYAFIGRSNVGKSSLINMLVDHKKLAKVSSKPGKTKLINHFLINSEWYLADLPGYGYAKVSKGDKKQFFEIINEYILERENLVNLFVLIDSRHPPQKIDIEFMEWLGENGIPFSMVFTKIDKLTSNNLNKNIKFYNKKMLEYWEELPVSFTSSAVKGTGREQLLGYIESINSKLGPDFAPARQ